MKTTCRLSESEAEAEELTNHTVRNVCLRFWHSSLKYITSNGVISRINNLHFFLSDPQFDFHLILSLFASDFLSHPYSDVLCCQGKPALMNSAGKGYSCYLNKRDQCAGNHCRRTANYFLNNLDWQMVPRKSYVLETVDPVLKSWKALPMLLPVRDFQRRILGSRWILDLSFLTSDDWPAFHAVLR